MFAKPVLLVVVAAAGIGSVAGIAIAQDGQSDAGSSETSVAYCPTAEEAAAHYAETGIDFKPSVRCPGDATSAPASSDDQPQELDLETLKEQDQGDPHIIVDEEQNTALFIDGDPPPGIDSVAEFEEWRASQAAQDAEPGK